jgi:hypothetical protein
LWAAITLAGGVIGDVRPAWAGPYWLVASPVGFLTSALLGHRWARRLGQVSADRGRKEMLHWSALLGTTALAALLVATGKVTPAAFGSIVLLFVALSYVLAGIHLHEGLVTVGVFIAAAYAVTLFGGEHASTGAGLVIAAVLVRQALKGRAVHAG